MKRQRTQKGITLVALIITIVVLLILAVVAIGAVRDSNIIGHVQNAASMYNQAQINEITQLKEVEDYINSTILNNQTVGGSQTITKTYANSESIYKYIITSDAEGDKLTMIVGETQMGPYPITYKTDLDAYGYTTTVTGIDNPEFVIGNVNGVETVAGIVMSGDKIYQGELNNDDMTFKVSSDSACFELVTE